MSYARATICENGHVVSHCTANEEKFCSMCGAMTFSLCPSCLSSIRGLFDTPGWAAPSAPYIKPMYCHSCGAPYPWTQKLLNSAVELLAVDDSLNPQERDVIRDSIPALIVDKGPATELAISNYKRLIQKAGKPIADALRQILINAASAYVKERLFS